MQGFAVRMQVLSALTLASLGGTAVGQTQVVRPPQVLYQMDVNTVTAPGSKTQKSLAIALFSQRRPAGAEATQSIPTGLKLGNSLTLKPAVPGTKPSAPLELESPPARSHVKVYWGCSETVAANQPRVLPLTALQSAALAEWMRGAPALRPGTAALGGFTPAVWPPQNTDTASLGLGRNASLVGKHSISGEGIPAGMQFTLPKEHDFLPELALSATGGDAKALNLTWTPLPAARGYGLSAIAGSADEYVVWVSAAPGADDLRWPPYPSTAQWNEWLQSDTLMNPQARQCAVPAGIFAGTSAGLLEATAYGDPVDITTPSRPSDVRTPWLPDWSVRVRVRSGTSLLLDSNGVPSKVHQDKPLTPAIPGVPVLPDLSGALKGLFGR